jgi:phage tail tube protein FII
VEIIHIDLEKGIEKIGGVDRLATARTNAGI